MDFTPINKILESAQAKALIAEATSEEKKTMALSVLYALLPAPVRWVIKRDAFDGYVRQKVFGQAAAVAAEPAPKKIQTFEL